MKQIEKDCLCHKNVKEDIFRYFLIFVSMRILIMSVLKSL